MTSNALGKRFRGIRCDKPKPGNFSESLKNLGLQALARVSSQKLNSLDRASARQAFFRKGGGGDGVP